LDGATYAVPLVYSVSLRGKLVPPDDAAGAVAEADADVELLLLDDGLLLQALATPSVSTATATVPYLARRHRLPVDPFVGLTCSYLLH
jgi:hypothetical protein